MHDHLKQHEKQFLDLSNAQSFYNRLCDYIDNNEPGPFSSSEDYGHVTSIERNIFLVKEQTKKTIQVYAA